MLPSNKRWLPATSASHSRDGAASSSTDPSAWALSEPGSVCSQLGETSRSSAAAAAAFAGAGHCSFLSIQPPPRENRHSKHTWAGLLRRGSLLPATKPATKPARAALHRIILLHLAESPVLSLQLHLLLAGASSQLPEYPGENESASLVRA